MNTLLLPYKFILAPMDGVADWVMREVLTEIGGPDLCVTEFLRVSNQVLPTKEFFKICPELKNASLTQSGIPVLMQLLGGDPQLLAENAQKACELGALGIDLNFGCPAKTVNRNDGGASLLQFPERIFKIVEAVRKSVPSHLSVSAKMRLGFNNKDLYLENAMAVQTGGAQWLAVHARTKEEGYRPPAHWNYLGLLKKQLKIPLIANGEINSVNDYLQVKKESQCEYFMIGRAAIRNPFLFQQIKSHEIQSDHPSHSTHPDIAINEKSNFAFEALTKDFYQRNKVYRSNYFAKVRTKQWLKFLALENNSAKDFFESVKAIECPIQFEEQIMNGFKITNQF
jgi:tRNA-dihydrouridine synthase C